MGIRKKEMGLARTVLVSIFIYGMIFPVIIFDIFLEIYHRICFLAYGYPYVKRRQYIKMDRGRLEYLTTWDKINCLYCGYANGLMRYAYKISSETERYWCPIKHEKSKVRGRFLKAPHQKNFAGFGNEDELKNILKNE